LRQYCQVYVKLHLQQKTKKVPKALALDTDKSILTQFENETNYTHYNKSNIFCQMDYKEQKECLFLLFDSLSNMLK